MAKINNDINHPIQPLVQDDAGVIRFKENSIVRFLLDSGNINLNTLACIPFSNEDRMQFAQLIGYSVCVYSDLSYVTDENYEKVRDAVDKIL